METEKIVAAFKAEAEAAHAQYPQYQGHWDGWVLGQLTRTVRTKLGVAGVKGELVLMAPTSFQGIRTFYSRRNRIDTTVTYSLREVTS